MGNEKNRWDEHAGPDDSRRPIQKLKATASAGLAHVFQPPRPCLNANRVRCGVDVVTLYPELDDLALFMALVIWLLAMPQTKSMILSQGLCSKVHPPAERQYRVEKAE
mmetsp:Transcript_96472/g.186043  ORF Transcript_96472/g.186043 Transcript_96472/m.186043 type:complete len:108 (+) Transcript_96472:626-949(+)